VVRVSGRIGNGLGNDGDALRLVAPNGTVADAVSWGADSSALYPSIDDAPEGHSLERRTPGVDTNTAADFVANARPSPGGAFVPFDDVGPPPAAGAVEAIGDGASSYGWLAWAAMAASAVALAAALGWRAFGYLRPRPPLP
jgi:hypothetical protein